MSPGSNTESYQAFAHIGLRENPETTSTRRRLLKITRRWPWKSEAAKECVTTHLPKKLDLKMDVPRDESHPVKRMIRGVGSETTSTYSQALNGFLSKGRSSIANPAFANLPHYEERANITDNRVSVCVSFIIAGDDIRLRTGDDTSDNMVLGAEGKVEGVGKVENRCYALTTIERSTIQYNIQSLW
ncbi:hypothetical protein ANN_17855 [Periplaneta americana]|uniref:Uncharacterized protein n=1 Tax=Periplaneta americana TaxID=6978 RepID=A0ABQ8SU46_PERAM|nr:hypothetical protein ANN_17855 [Periplaneta americana]